MTAYEDFVLERVQSGTSILSLYPPTDTDNLKLFDEWRKANDRWWQRIPHPHQRRSLLQHNWNKMMTSAFCF